MKIWDSVYKYLKQVFMPKVPQKLKILKKKFITPEFKNTSFLFYKHWPNEKCRLHLLTGRRRPSCTFLWSTSTAAFFLVDSRQPFSSRPLFPCANTILYLVIVLINLRPQTFLRSLLVVVYLAALGLSAKSRGLYFFLFTFHNIFKLDTFCTYSCIGTSGKKSPKPHERVFDTKPLQRATVQFKVRRSSERANLNKNERA